MWEGRRIYVNAVRGSRDPPPPLVRVPEGGYPPCLVAPALKLSRLSKGIATR